MFKKIFSINDENKIVISDGNRNITYMQLQNLLTIGQNELKERGYGSGNRVILNVQDQYDFIINMLCLLSVEAWVIPFFSENKHKLVKMKYEISGKIFEEKDLCFTNQVSEKKIKFVYPDEENCGILHMTSGTTGENKYCIRKLSSFKAESESFKKLNIYHQNDKILSLCPVEHSFASGAGLFNSICHEAAFYVINKFNPKKVLVFIMENHINHVLMIPEMLNIFNKVSIEYYNIDSLTSVMVGAGRVHEKDYYEFKNKYKCKIYRNYGSSETGCVITSDENWSNGSTGKLMPGVEMYLLNEENERIEEADTVGLMYIKCGWMFEGYYKKNEIVRNQGFYQTSDLACIDSQGNIFIKGRIDRVIKINGNNVNCDEMERFISHLTGVTECKIIICEKEGKKKKIKSIIVANKSKYNLIKTRLKEKYPPYQLPEIVFVDNIVKNRLGKIDSSKYM